MLFIARHRKSPAPINITYYYLQLLLYIRQLLFRDDYLLLQPKFVLPEFFMHIELQSLNPSAKSMKNKEKADGINLDRKVRGLKPLPKSPNKLPSLLTQTEASKLSPSHCIWDILISNQIHHVPNTNIYSEKAKTNITMEREDETNANAISRLTHSLSKTGMSPTRNLEKKQKLVRKVEEAVDDFQLFKRKLVISFSEHLSASLETQNS